MLKGGSSSSPEMEEEEASELRPESQGPWPGRGLSTGGHRQSLSGQGCLWSLAQVFGSEGEEFGDRGKTLWELGCSTKKIGLL